MKIEKSENSIWSVGLRFEKLRMMGVLELGQFVSLMMLFGGNDCGSWVTLQKVYGMMLFV